MFFHITLEKNLVLPPKYFGPRLHSTLVTKLHSEVEGTCSGRYGFVVTVTNVDDIGKGQVQQGTGHAVFSVKYKAIVFRPFKGEVLDAVVTQVTKMGFFAEAGPLQIFVSQHLIPQDMTFDGQSNPPCFISEDGNSKIEKDADVRLKIVGTRVDATEIVRGWLFIIIVDFTSFAIGSIKEDFLGVIS